MEPTIRIIAPYPYVNEVATGGTTPGQWVYDPKTDTIVFKEYSVNTQDAAERVSAKVPEFGIQDFFVAMKQELEKGGNKYGEGDTTLEFVRGIDPNFELGAIAKYISRIAHGDSRSETDIIKIATYAYLYWERHYHASSNSKNT
jgi:hypothetical protein